MSVDLSKLSLGEEISPIGGTQYKRAVMEAAGNKPTFSRMSGIQEWQNCVYLFVNVYGDGYKNVLLENGEMTWFAQPSQWEGTPVVQRLINSMGGILDDDVVEPTAVCLFCRAFEKPFVYCGTLSYVAHDPHRLPIRFVFKIDNFPILSSKPAFKHIQAECRKLVSDS